MPSLSRNRSVLIAGLAIVVALGAGLLWLRASDTSHGDADVARAPITVTPLQADVLLRSMGAEFQTLASTATTSSGSAIRTSSTGRALISSANAHTTLIDYNSEITLSQEAGNHTRVGLLAGAVWSRLEKTFDSGEYYEIKTGNTIAAVRGTSFGVWYAGSTTTIVVVDGSVLFSAIDPETGQIVPGTEVLVSAGHRAVRTGTDRIVVSVITDAELRLPWVIFNTNEHAPRAVPAVPGRPTTSVSEPSAPIYTPPASTSTSPSAPAPSSPAAASTQPELSSASPSSVPQGSSKVITLKGTSLQDVRIVEVGTTRVAFDIVSPTTITFTVTDIAPGTYSVKATAAGGKNDILSRAITITKPADTGSVVSPNGAP